MANIGSILGIASAAFQAVQSLGRPDGESRKAEQLFSRLDASGNGTIDTADLQSAFERFSDKVSEKLSAKAEGLFTKLDTNGDKQIDQGEFSNAIAKLSEQLDQQYMRLRMQGDQLASAGFTRDDLNGFVSNITSNFDKADADGNGKVTLKEILDARRANELAAGLPASQNGDMAAMVQAMKLMQAYGVNQGNNGNAANAVKSALSITA